MKKLAGTRYFARSFSIRGTATAPNSPREIGVGLVRPRAMKPDMASKSKVMQTMCFLILQDSGFRIRDSGFEVVSLFAVHFREKGAVVARAPVRHCIGDVVRQAVVDDELTVRYPLRQRAIVLYGVYRIPAGSDRQ